MICANCGTADITGPCPTCGHSGLLRERFVLHEVLGHGAHGTTYRASEGDRPVAVKELPLRPGVAPKAVQLFHREAEVLRQLSHPQIPAYLAHFTAGEGKARALYIVQEYVQGADFRRILDEHRFSEKEVLQILADLLPVFVYLHGLSPPVVHRDVKLRNVMRREDDGRLFLVDFGSVRDALVDSQLGGSTVAGTFGYMAPEQFAGDAVPASDLYGLGAFAVALLTRQEPHTLLGPRNELRWAQHARPTPPTELFIAALLEPEVDRRLGDAAQALEAAQALLAGDAPDLPAPVEPLLPVRLGRALPALRERAPPARVAQPNPSPTRLLWTARTDHALAPERYDLLVADIEDALGLPGNASVVGRSLRWQTPQQTGRLVQVRVEPMGDGMRVTAREQLGGLMGGLYGGLGGGIGGGVGGGLAFMAFGFGGIALGIAWIAAVLLFAFGLATAIYMSARRTRNDQLQLAVDSVVRTIEEAS